MPLILGGYAATAGALAVFPAAAATGLWGLVAAMVLLYGGINAQRSPFQALVADAVPSRMRPLATGLVTFQMWAGAVLLLMLGRVLGMAVAFRVAAGVVGHEGDARRDTRHPCHLRGVIPAAAHLG